MLRAQFLAAIGSAAASTAIPSPTPSPAASQNPWELCDSKIGLPYDRPLLMKIRVLDGPEFDLAKYRGKPLMMNLFATWCGPYNMEMPSIVDAAEEYRDRGLEVVAVNDREEDNTVRAFRKKYSIDFPIAMDETGGLFYAIEHGQKFEAHNIVFPITMFIDPNGYLYCYVTGSMSREELRYRIEKFLSWSVPSPTPSAAPSPGRRSGCFA